MKIYFHGAKEGHKVDALKKHNKCSFVVMNKGYKEEGSWIWNVTSVVCFGKMNFITDEEDAVKIVRKIGLKYNPNPNDVEEDIKRNLKRVLILEFNIEHFTGKLVNES